ncbi:protein FAM169B isoform X7 [Hippocampus zosterae]|uniref:protein FAM169B isoform X7 n=1 Tax=Hippocampus zosterae TaxID=109293 RepID=UPI00223E2BF3|nr:protein FAM169B isoform X7 [Hippocampus zosterae]
MNVEEGRLVGCRFFETHVLHSCFVVFNVCMNLTVLCRKMFPVDLPPVVETDLRSASEQYLLSLKSRPEDNDCFQSSKTSKLEITANNIKWLQLFEDDQARSSLLALHPPDDPAQVVALYLHGSWWSVNDVIRTSCKSRTDLLPAVCVTAGAAAATSCLFWTLCCEQVLGISVPLSPSMVAVCRRFLQLNEDYRDRLYEVEAPGEWTQRRNVWLNIQLSRYSLSGDEVV